MSHVGFLPFLVTFTTPFRRRGFTWLWLSSAFGTLGMIISQLVLGWVALQQANSSLAVGAVLAARFAPPVALGLPAGLLADLFDRRKLLFLAYLGSAFVPLLAILLIRRGQLDLPALLGIAVLLGIFDTLRTTTSQASIYDIVGTGQATTAISLTLLAGQVFGVLAGLVGGNVIDQFGPMAAFLALGIIDLMAALLLFPIRGLALQQQMLTRGWEEILHASTLLIRNNSVRSLAFIIAATEAFAFSSTALLPTFARDVFNTRASGLGFFYSARSLGGILGSIILASLPSKTLVQRLLVYLSAFFGISLVAFSSTKDFSLALVLSGLIGVAIASVDALALSLLQHSVTGSQRGSAIGVWLICTGFGPIGDIEIGYLAAAIGAPLAQAVNGAILVAILLLLELVRVVQNKKITC